MDDFDLITDEEFASLPSDPQRRFLAFEKTCRMKMSSLISQDTVASFDRMIRLQYMHMVAAAAHELDIQGIGLTDRYDDMMEGFDEFANDVSYVTTKLRLRVHSAKDPESVQLANRTRAKIELQIRRLRSIIETSELPDDRKRDLLKKLAALSDEVSKSRVPFGAVMAIIAAVSIGVTQGTSFLADAPDALMTIQSLFGADKQAEDAETLRLGPPQRALPAPPKAGQATAPRFTSHSMDDDIPF